MTPEEFQALREEAIKMGDVHPWPKVAELCETAEQLHAASLKFLAVANRAMQYRMWGVNSARCTTFVRAETPQDAVMRAAEIIDPYRDDPMVYELAWVSHILTGTGAKPIKVKLPMPPETKEDEETGKENEDGV